MEDEDAGAYPKVGTTALMLLALNYPSLRNKYLVQQAEFRRSIDRSQMPNGRFVTHFGLSEDYAREREFSPGQVLLGLVMEVEAGSGAAAAACLRAFSPYREHFMNAPKTAFVGWQIEAWARLAQALSRDDFAQFAFQQADWLAKKQISGDVVKSFAGGFRKGDEDPGFSTVVYTEALIAALRLAHHANDIARQRKYSAAVRAGLAFCAQLQLDMIPDAFFPNPHKRHGGIALGLTELNVRCDVVQHFITLSLAACDSFGFVYP